MRVFGLAGWNGSGKTTLMTGLIAAINRRGFSVSTLKHAHHSFDIDQKGKDSHAHRIAGAAEVLVASDRRWALMCELRDEAEPTLDALLARLSPVDLVLIEGWKYHPHAKLEIHRASLGKPMLWPDDPAIVAVAADAPISGLDRPFLALESTESIADFILNHVGLIPAESAETPKLEA